MDLQVDGMAGQSRLILQHHLNHQWKAIAPGIDSFQAPSLVWKLFSCARNEKGCR